MSSASSEDPEEIARRLGLQPEASGTRRGFARWLLADSPYILMLVLPLAGVTFRLPVGYWVSLIPIFGAICIVAGWSRVDSRDARLRLIVMQTLNWAAFLLATYLVFSSAVQGLLNPVASSLMMLTLLALGTFVAGIQALVWRLCVAGGTLFLAVPAVGWLKQSAALLLLATLVVIALGGLTWWVSERRN
jgi:hypothetical protein